MCIFYMAPILDSLYTLSISGNYFSYSNNTIFSRDLSQSLTKPMYAWYKFAYDKSNRLDSQSDFT